MKKSLSILLCCIMIFASSVPSFASATSWDTTDQANLSAIKNALTTGTNSLFGIVNTIGSRLIYNNKGLAQILTDVLNTLSSNGGSGTTHTVAWWLADIDGWLQNIYGALTGSVSGGIGDTLNHILSALTYTDAGGALKSWMADIWQVNSVNLPKLNDINNRFGLTSYPNTVQSNSSSPFYYYYYKSTGIADRDYFTPSATPIFGGFLWILQSMSNSLAYGFQNLTDNFNATQNVVNWGNLGTSTFTAYSTTDGIFKYLSSIQAPVARLSYVLASDERIAAQEAAAPVEQAVVDDFIDPTGDASASTSDISSIADLSSGYQQNFGSTASVTGIFDIFNSNNFGWFSAETTQQLDTTTQVRGSSFETPLLNRQIEEINSILGVNNND